MAEVFLARKPLGSTFRRVVVKRMHTDLVEDERFVEMFLREAGILAQLNHANVVQIYDLGTTDDGAPYFVMEYLDGISLHDLAVRAWRLRKPLPLELVLRVLAEVARGLDYVHNKHNDDGVPLCLVHRDIAPDNVFFVKDGTVKLLDFGVARAATMKVITARGEVKGKLPFMAPEQIEGNVLDGRADIFSLGVSGMWLLTGKRPFKGANELNLIRTILKAEPPRASQINIEVAPWLDALLARMLEKDRANRPDGGGVESAIVKNAGAHLDRARDVAFVEELLAMKVPPQEGPTRSIPATRRGGSGVFARAHPAVARNLLATAKLVPVRLHPEPTTVEDDEVEVLDSGFEIITADDVGAGPVGGKSGDATDWARPRAPLPRAANIDMPIEADDPSGDTQRLTESQLGIRKERM